MKFRAKKNDFERLEFLGDRVLGLAIAEMLYKEHQKEKEGELAKRFASLVSKESCTHVAESINLLSYLSVIKVDIVPHSSILADAMEALLGAIYLDGGFDAVKKTIHHLWKDLLNQTIQTSKDFKSVLQELSQSHKKGLPKYDVIEMTGPAHAPIFIVRVTIEDMGSEEAQGATKKQAEQFAAEKLYRKLEK
jgi:ribonuclease-3